MPSIAGCQASQVVVSETADDVLRLDGQLTPQKRKLRSHGPLEVPPSGSISAPLKLKSSRRCVNSTPKRSGNGYKINSNEEPVQEKCPVKKISCSLNCNLDWDPRGKEQMSAVKEALHVSTAPSTVVCREGEHEQILDFVKTCLEQDKASSLYICGCPGTGKSLSVEKVREQLVDWTEKADRTPPGIVKLNCTSLRNTSEIFTKILDESHQSKKINGSKSPLQHLQNLYSLKQHSDSSKMMIVIADELDYLVTKDRVVLHELFMLTTLPFSRCILIGIANSIDLADRFLPRLKSLNCTPMVITFRAYSKDQILKILQERLMALPYTVFQPQAVELCARKVAAASGDMRKALSVCRSAVEILEAELNDATSKLDPASTEVESSEQLISPAPANNIVKINHMVAALSKAFRSPIVDTIQSLPQHQQIILCSTAKFFRGKKKDTTLGELNKSYLEICKSSLIPPVGISEFLDMSRVLSDQGLLQLGPARDDKCKRVTLKVDESDITFALQGVRFFRNCLK